MKIPLSAERTYETPPEYTGAAVCVDVTPLKEYKTQYGPKQKFKVVFELPASAGLQKLYDRDQKAGHKVGAPFTVQSAPFLPSFSEKAGWRKFIKGWLGRDLSKQEMEEFDTEQLIGRSAFIVVSHHQEGEETYANIVACTPDKSPTPPVATGRYTRIKDREQQATTGGNGSTYRSTGEQTPAAAGNDWRSVKVHIGRHAYQELGNLDVEAVQALITGWLPSPKGKGNPKPTADDKRLIAALEEVQEELKKKAAGEEDVPY